MSDVEILPEVEALRSYRDRRSERRRLLAIAAKWSKSNRLAMCGRAVVAPEGTMALFRNTTENGVVAGRSGIGWCRLKGLCPVCAPHERDKWAKQVDESATVWLNSGRAIWYFVLTLATPEGEPVEETTNALYDCQAKLTSGQWWAEYRQRHRVVGLVRAPEWTLRLDGSGHPHMNWLAFLDHDQGDAIGLVGELLIRWQTVCRSLGREASIRHGVGWDKVTLNEHGTTRTISEYMAKGPESWSAGAELLRTDVKRSRSEVTFAPFDLLRWFDETGDIAAIHTWRAYERAQDARAARTFPAALKKAIAAVQAGQQVQMTLDESTDTDAPPVDALDEGAAGTEGLDDIRPDTSVIVAEVEPVTWTYIRRHRLDDAIDSIIESDALASEIPELLRMLLDLHGASSDVCNGILEPSPDWGKHP